MGVGRPAAKIDLSSEEEQVLQGYAKRRTTAQALALRARIILGCATGLANKDVAVAEGVTQQTVSKWNVLPGESAEEWLKRARALLSSNLVGTASIGRRLQSSDKLADVLAEASPTALPAMSSHAAKGLEFPAVCVVLTPQTSGNILNVLTGVESASEHVEQARKIYVAASRAERLLAIATPKSRAAALKGMLDEGGHATQIVTL